MSKSILGQSNFETEQLMDKTIYGQSKVMGFDPKLINLVFNKMGYDLKLTLLHLETWNLMKSVNKLMILQAFIN